MTALPTPEVEKWEHVAGTYDGVTKKIYLNGKLIGEEAQVFNLQGTNTSDVRIGCAQMRPAYTVDGAIDDVVFYNRALSEEEINKGMKHGPIIAVSSKGKLATTWASIKCY